MRLALLLLEPLERDFLGSFVTSGSFLNLLRVGYRSRTATSHPADGEPLRRYCQ
jgi:hypothetical protein